jgi:hypothetical protein
MECKQQVPPLRYAPVGMTILLQEMASRAVEWLPTVKQNCHPDRSAAQWRDLLFRFQSPRTLP